MALETNDARPGGQSSDVAADQKSHIDDILKRIDALPVLDTRPEDEILGYDDIPA